MGYNIKKGISNVTNAPGVKQVVDVHKKGYDSIVDPLGVGDTFFGKGVKKPNLDAQNAARMQALEDMANGLPASYIAEKYAGDFSPEQLAEIQQQSDSELKGISIDPRYKEAQLAALQQLQDRSVDGYNIEDKAAMSRTLNEAAMQERAQRDSLLANAQSRGAASGGNVLAQQLMAQQGAASRANDGALQIAADGRRRALEAVMASGQLGGQMQGQDFDQQARIAAAQDSINQFNTRNVNDRSMYNNQLVNNAQLRNVDTRQGIASTNAAGRNNFNQNQFNNQARISEVQYNHQTNDINAQNAAYQAKVNARNAKKGAILGTAGTAAGAYFGGPQGAQTGNQLGQGVAGMTQDDQ